MTGHSQLAAATSFAVSYWEQIPYLLSIAESDLLNPLTPHLRRLARARPGGGRRIG